jgi:hypothetical protein
MVDIGEGTCPTLALRMGRGPPLYSRYYSHILAFRCFASKCLFAWTRRLHVNDILQNCDSLFGRRNSKPPARNAYVDLEFMPAKNFNAAIYSSVEEVDAHVQPTRVLDSDET